MNDQHAASELRRIREELTGLLPDVEQRLLREEELMQKLDAAEGAIEAVLDAGSRAHRVFDRHRRENLERWWSGNLKDYVHPSRCERIAQHVAMIDAALTQLEPDVLTPSYRLEQQVVLSAGDTFHAKRVFWELLSSARTAVVVVDPYLDDKIFPYVESLDPAIEVALLTCTRKPIFPVLLHALQQVRGSVQAKYATGFHDRFVIIDGTDVWHLGCSVNGLGDKLSMITKVTQAGEAQKLINEYGTLWQSGTPA